MKIFLLAILLLIELNANDYIKNNTCKACHSTIYSEFYNSSHRKASIFEDPIHKAVWDLHPNKQKGSYTCAKCHTPSDLELLKKLKENKKALPIKNIVQTHEAISCVYCHSIKSIEKHEKVNTNILTKEKKVFFAANEENKELKDKKYKDEVSMFGMMKKTSGSPYHTIDYSNEDFYTGKMCMGCHQKLQNNNNFDLCRVDMKGAQNEEKNCITCHMPKVKGTATSIKITDTHRFHGFASASNNQDLLTKYVKIKFKEKSDNFEIAIKNESSHNLFLQPLRLAQLRVNVLRGDKRIKLDTKSFMRIIGKDGKPTMPWLANSVVKNNMIKANENRVITYDFKLKANDSIEVVFGYYKVNPKMWKKLKLENDKKSTKFNILKSEFYKSSK
tara:strand:+ start:27481 stop:28644 length:1164 start_codon:yes stop_codon:yes gene_type:complete